MRRIVIAKYESKTGFTRSDVHHSIHSLILHSRSNQASTSSSGFKGHARKLHGGTSYGSTENKIRVVITCEILMDDSHMNSIL